MPAAIEIFHDIATMRAWSEQCISNNQRMAFVPTMGALHEGHLSLVREAKKHGDQVLVSIFVNPTQFGPHEDLAQYPRDLHSDVSELHTAGCDAVFAPSTDIIYPPGFKTRIVVDDLSQHLCGTSRPTHFSGVCTVVSILFRITRCHVAVFGEKDFQQLAIVKRLTHDLHLDVEVIGCPIVRENNGLAMSSRNANLTPESRKQAPVLYEALRAVRASGIRKSRTLIEMAIAIIKQASEAQIDYVEVINAETLNPIEEVNGPARMAIAVNFSGARLIDNLAL
jgi:pantoate--beta-alanine ligase